MTIVTDLSKQTVPSFFKEHKPKKEKKSAAEKREGMSEAYLNKIRALPCCVCKKPPKSEAHHLKSTGERGIGLRSTDRWAIPTCHDCHIYGVELVASNREIKWFEDRGIDCLYLAVSLWGARDSLERMHGILTRHWDGK